MIKIITRTKAKSCGLTRYFTGKPCKQGHICEKYTSNSTCVKCLKITKRNWRRNNPEKVNEECKRYYYRNQKYMCLRSSKWAKENSDRLNKRRKKHRLENPEQTKQWKQKEYLKGKGTPERKLRNICAKVGLRLKDGKCYEGRKYKLYYTAEKYENYLIKDTLFKTLQEAHDFTYHVDHIVPISYIGGNINDKILAFEVAMDLNNLRLIPAKDNLSKHNKTDIPIVQETIMYLNCKYNVSLPFEAYDK